MTMLDIAYEVGKFEGIVPSINKRKYLDKSGFGRISREK